MITLNVVTLSCLNVQFFSVDHHQVKAKQSKAINNSTLEERENVIDDRKIVCIAVVSTIGSNYCVYAR